MSGFFVPHDLKAPLKGAANGPLAGLSAAVKDLYAIAGEKTGGGNPDWLAQAQTATRHAAAVEKLLAAGASIIGKTITDEFFYSVAGMNAHYGTPSNLRAPGMRPGGSVRVPAAFCGLYGIRTTHGRIETRGAMDMSPSFDTIGWFSASAGLFRAVGQVLLDDKTVSAPIDSLLVPGDAFAQADEPVAGLLRDALSAMKGVLPRPQAIDIAPNGFEQWRDAVRIIQAYEIWQVYGRFVAEKKPHFGPGVAERMQIASKITTAEADAARKVRAAAREHIRATIKPGTVMALPTAPCIAPQTDTPQNELESFRVRVMRLTCIAGLGGLPQVTIPVGTVAGCPVGLSFVGWAGGDEALLDLAVAVAKYCGLERA